MILEQRVQNTNENSSALKQQINQQNIVKNRESEEDWKENYNQNVAHIKKQLQDLRKATMELRRKISANQKGIKRALKPKRSKAESLAKRSPIKKHNEEIKQNCETEESQTGSRIKRLSSFEQSIVNKMVNKFLSSPKESIQEQPCTPYIQKAIRKIRNVHDFLFKIIVKNRIKTPRNNKRNIEEILKDGVKVRPYAQPRHARRLRSRRSIRV